MEGMNEKALRFFFVILRGIIFVVSILELLVVGHDCSSAGILFWNKDRDGFISGGVTTFVGPGEPNVS